MSSTPKKVVIAASTPPSISPKELAALTTEGDGKIERIEHGQVEDVDRPFTGAAQLIEKIDAVVEELGTRTQERRFIQAFSADHRDFLKRYAELKLKIDRLISD